MTTVNITVTNDADFYQTFQYVMNTSGSPIDITGASLEMMLRRHAEDADALLRLATDTGEIVLTDPLHGFFTVLIRQDMLAHLALGSYDHSLIKTVGLDKTKIWSGTLVNNAGPTR
jgi:hypothetical protein